MSRRLFQLFALLVLVPAAAYAKPETAIPVATSDTLHLTLDAAIARALGSGSDMQVARAAVGVAQGRVRE
ncbi:MAG: hypothetical protein K8R56_05665, partial [Candidatus Eisenbacteria bacterium]|nr:hypothetical protein [Candidatus Eisenbacteria bacterium]